MFAGALLFQGQALIEMCQKPRPELVLHVRAARNPLVDISACEVFDSHQGFDVGVGLSPKAKGGKEARKHGHDLRLQKLQKRSPADLRLQAQALWTALESAKVYIPPLEAEKPTDKFQLERHGHGRGNTKSTKRRRKREDRSDLGLKLSFSVFFCWVWRSLALEFSRSKINF